MALFGFGNSDPYKDATQDTADRQSAWDNIKDNLPALGLAFGLSMLARNNGSRNLGQLVGQAGNDALSAYGTWQKIQEAKQRQEMLDKERADEREYQRSQDAFKNDMAERRLGMDERQMAFNQNIARQRLGLAYASHALQKQNAARAAAAAEAERQGGKFYEKLGGWVMPDGSFKPLQYPEGYGAPGTGIDLDDPATKKFGEEMGKRGADMYDNLQKSGMSAYDTLGKMGQVKSILDSGLYTGWGGDVVQGFRKAGAALGMSDAQAAANGELMKRINNEMALMARNPDSGMGMPGSISDKDREFLVEMQPGLTNTAEGNKMMVEMSSRIAQRRVDIAAMADDYVSRKGKLDSGFYRQVREYANAHPLFEGLSSKKSRRPLSAFGG